MKIKRLKYKENDSGWELAPIEFFSDLTLLVGISGVGKTRILNAISNLKQIANGKAIWGVEWDVLFSTIDGRDYKWQGAFEEKSSDSNDVEDFPFGIVGDSDDEEVRKPRITTERLTENDVLVVERDIQRILLRGKATPKLSPFESVLKILNEEDGIRDAHKGFLHILSSERQDLSSGNAFYDMLEGQHFSTHCKKFTTLDSIREAKFSSLYKLAIVHHNIPELFRQIVDRFIGVFPQVQDLTIERNKHRYIGGEIPVLKIKEHGNEKWIRQEKISSGMLRTLRHLSRMKFWPDGTVVLVDEFENSLGINCINFITQDLLDESNRLQFILTSHHPYIINNIGTRHWKIVSRVGSTVTARNASEFGLEKSSHEAFIKLINLDQYQEGIVMQ